MDRNESIKHITIDGSLIHSYKEFIDIIQKELEFPRDCIGKIDCYLDWIRDLQWTSYNCIVLTIINSKCLLTNGNRTDEIIPHFQNVILPFWKDEYQRCIPDPVHKEIILDLK